MNLFTKLHRPRRARKWEIKLKTEEVGAEGREGQVLLEEILYEMKKQKGREVKEKYERQMENHYNVILSHLLHEQPAVL